MKLFNAVAQGFLQQKPDMRHDISGTRFNALQACRPQF